MRLVFKVKDYPKDWKIGQSEPQLTESDCVFKVGDDVRQDQLVLLMFTIMDTLLKKVGQDLQFTLYKTLAMSNQDGVLNFVKNSKTIQEILQQSNDDMHKYLQSLETASMPFSKIQQNYIDSNAGYAVATYLMAVGDRHLENLMVQQDGKMFHIDFGFILGKHPPLKGNFIPPIRVNKDMVQGMGGMDSDGYKQFKKKAVDAFLELRKHRHFLVDVVMAMADSYIPDLPSADCIKILDALNDRFLPLMTD